MIPFRTVLVAADFSEGSREAFHVACSIAHGDKMKVFVLNVLEPKYEPETPVYISQQTVHYNRVPRDPSEHESLKKRLCEAYAPDQPLHVDYRTKEGDVAEEILHACDEIGCDLIAMGTHGRTGLRRMLAGSVAEAVLRRACCPVLTLRESETPRTAAQTGVILHPTDFSKCSKAALQVACALAQARGSRLILLHVLPIETVICGEVPAPPDVVVERDTLTALASAVKVPDVRYPVTTSLTQGDPAAEIVRIAEEEPGCDIIVMGTHGRSGLDRLLMGSVAEAVLRQAGCPVLTVKVPDPGAFPEPQGAGAAIV